MLGRLYRFHGHNTVTVVYRRGETVRGSHISLKYSRRVGDKPYRVAVVVSRKVSKSAVVRNRIRRRIYELVRTFDKPIPNGTDLVFTVFSDQVADLAPTKLQQNVEQLLQKATANRSQTGESRGIVNPEGNAV